MDVVAELFPNKRKANYSYNFLHLSIQEYLGAVHVSLMDDTSKQERLLERHVHNSTPQEHGLVSSRQSQNSRA